MRKEFCEIGNFLSSLRCGFISSPLSSNSFLPKEKGERRCKELSEAKVPDFIRIQKKSNAREIGERPPSPTGGRWIATKSQDG